MNVYDNISVNTHTVAESSLLKATVAGHIYSLKCHATNGIDNGSIVTLGTWVEDQVYNSADYAAGKQPLLVLTTPIAYNSDRKTYQDEKYFYNAKDEIMRAYELYVGDIFTVSADAVTKISSASDVTVGNYVGVSSGKYQEAASAASTGFVGQILEKVNDSYRIAVVKTGC